MKKLFTTFCAVVFFSCLAQVSKAGTYYVISGESFSLSPAAGSNFFQYIWTLDPGAGQTIQTLTQASGGVLTHTFSDATSSPTLHKISFGVIEVLDGCLSNVVEHTIIVLPKLTVSITADKENFCTDKPVASTLTASVSATTGLGTYGVTVSPFAWSKGGTLISGQTGSTLSVTEAATYTALVSYVLPTAGDYIPTASKLLNAVTGGTKQILHNLPIPTVPSISLN
ncbi:hypothetical protein GCM10010967_19090 [Dyadobacter beijingensis]|uniref:Ig-like domain-containing protein n=1 Tax=Dyadobacter beijingensis TaxID=365489 RepID=A0ABQ2HQC0_9BACT|nr:hypothetical protein [Dyadobacter beijingensis]GGM86883.1 hypothetical protein GCM10010967_19090 [Dyadobacter beijingensis]